MQTSLVRVKKVVALNGFLYYFSGKHMGMLLWQITVAIVEYGMFSTVLLLSL